MINIGASIFSDTIVGGFLGTIVVEHTWCQHPVGRGTYTCYNDICMHICTHDLIMCMEGVFVHDIVN